MATVLGSTCGCILVVTDRALMKDEARSVDDSPPPPSSGARVHDPAAERVRRLVSDHVEEITRYLARIGVPEAEVDDVAQEVFLVASSKIDGVAPGGDRPFLYAVASRVAHNARSGMPRLV